MDSLPFIDLIKLLQHHGQPARLLLDEALDYFPDNPQFFFKTAVSFLLKEGLWRRFSIFKGFSDGVEKRTMIIRFPTTAGSSMGILWPH
jgi:hypothetical protein